jgi:hypothetical protein
MPRFFLAASAIACLVPSLASAQAVALGLSQAQIEDADLVDAKGREIGEVERVMMNSAGAVTGLIVEIDQRDPKPDKLVQIPLTNLKAIAERGDPGDFNIQTQQTAAALLALPAATLR